MALLLLFCACVGVCMYGTSTYCLQRLGPFQVAGEDKFIWIYLGTPSKHTIYKLALYTLHFIDLPCCYYCTLCVCMNVYFV